MAEKEVHRLAASSMAKLDRGLLDASINQALLQVAQDCADRPTDDRVREVNIKITVQPLTVLDEASRTMMLTGASGQYKVTTKVPPRESKPLNFGIQQNKDGSDCAFLFNENAPDNWKQRTFLPEEAEEAE